MDEDELDLSAPPRVRFSVIALDRALLNTTGMLYYKLETATDSDTKKMIQAK